MVIQIQHLLKLNKNTKMKNILSLAIQIQHLLKLNKEIANGIISTGDSNTTLVKVKLFLLIISLFTDKIQIQHLLKLNASKINTFINNYSL